MKTVLRLSLGIAGIFCMYTMMILLLASIMRDSTLSPWSLVGEVLVMLFASAITIQSIYHGFIDPSKFDNRVARPSPFAELPANPDWVAFQEAKDQPIPEGIPTDPPLQTCGCGPDAPALCTPAKGIVNPDLVEDYVRMARRRAQLRTQCHDDEPEYYILHDKMDVLWERMDSTQRFQAEDQESNLWRG